jgi:hypothetical protein
MSQEYLRTYRLFEFADVQEHLLILGDLKGDCAKCRALGIDHQNATRCPECGTPFKYVTSRRLESNPGERFHLVRRISERRPDLCWVDYSDYQKILGHKKAKDFFA